MSQDIRQPDRNKDLSPLQQSYLVITKLKASLDAYERQQSDPIAIVGASCRFPGGAVDLSSYWRLLREGVSAVREVPRDRWDVDAFYDPDPAAPGKTATRCGAFLDGVDQFDPLFFGISPREAASLDPQQRLLLEVTWEAIERAGYAPDRLAPDRTGVFVGIGQMDYAQLLLGNVDPARVDVYAGTGNGFCFASGRLSYVLGLRGPNLAVDTACSSSLISVHLACQSLRRRETDMAIAAGVQLMLSPQPFVGLTKLGALSPDGKCKTFDASADGYGRGEGCGVIILKRLSEALAAGDHVLAVIRGSAINHDGSSSGFTVPNGLAQQEVLRRALDNAGISPADVGYVETHGTGTQLGDPIDVEAVAEVYGRDRKSGNPLIIGSVKTNIGHLEAASGIAGLLKVVLALQQGEIPPHLNFSKPNPHIRWDRLPIKVPTAPMRWTSEKRIASVSSFGLSGANAHVVLEAAPAPTPRDAVVDRTRHVLPLSARSPKALTELASRYDQFLAANPDASLADVCFTAAAGRAHLPCRAAMVASSVGEMRQRLAAIAPVEPNEQPPKIAFLFTGQGSQYAGMGASLYKTQPSFRAAIDACDEILRPHLQLPLLDVLYPKDGRTSPLHDTAYTQPALFAIEYALANLWMSWGIEPAAMMGHSVGEYVAACLAGVFSLEDGLTLIAHRGRLMQALPRGGAMAVLFTDAGTAAAAIGAATDRVSIAALNGERNTVISGDGDEVARIVTELERDQIRSTRLQVSHAFHSPLMEPMLREFERVAESVQYRAPQKTILSNADGRPARADVATPKYWVEHVRRPVNFAAGMATLHQQGCNVFLEAGPKPSLLAMGRQCLPDGNALWLPSLNEGQEDWQTLLQSVAKLYERGARIDWSGFDRDYPRRRVPLPTYPFQRQRYWLDEGAKRPAALARSADDHPFLGRRLRLPLSRETRFETQFTLASRAYLRDHKLFDVVVVPGASHLAMVLSAAFETFRGDAFVLEDILFPQPLLLTDESQIDVQTILMPEANGATGFRVVSSAADGHSSEWTVHLSGRLRPSAIASQPEDLANIRARCTDEISARDFYAVFHAAGYGLGTSFQWLESIWQGDGESMSRLRMPQLPDSADHYRLYPSLIDSCFQSLAACWRGADVEAGRDDILIPFSVAGFQCHRAQPQGDLWCHTRIRRDGNSAEGAVIADMRLFDASGQLVAEVTGFEGRKASRRLLLRSLRGTLNDALYELAWLPSSAEARSLAPNGRWLIIADGDDPAAGSLAQMLRGDGQACIVAREFTSGAWSGIVYLRTEGDACASVLQLLRDVARDRSGDSPRLWLVTRNAVPAGPERRALSLEQSPLWGLGRVIAMEHPELHCVRVDLDGDDAASLLFREIAQSGREDQIAFRSGQRYVARLARFTSLRRAPRGENGYKLAMPSFGVLDELRLEPLARHAPGSGEVEIAVRANGLNLRDVLLALGMFNEQLAKYGITRASDISFGFECAGVITAVGDGVDSFKPGDEVMGLTLGGMNSHVIADARLICRKPPRFTLEDAATIPLAFLSAVYGLHQLAQLKPGERVLIHAAAGGVGQAAVQWARSIGAEIFATASPSKWETLAQQGVQHIMSSRTLDFAEQIREITGGRGVDCVLNSLTGEFIPRSLDVLAEGGRFVELGRIGIWSEEEVHAARPDVRYFNFDMAQLCRDQAPRLSSLLAELTAQFEDGTLQPIARTLFPIEDAAAAFRFMAQAKHVGKIVITHPRAASDAEEAMIRADAAYIITGGLGALGLQLADWMIGRGARHLVLSARSEPSEAAQRTIAQMQQRGATVRIVRGDVSHRAVVEELLREGAALAPVRGIVHAAGVLDDGILLNQTTEQFRRVMAPKVDGAKHLHELSSDLALDFFLCYSSMASLLGSPGQGNYAAANAYLDALAHHRRALGMPALTINWGAWAGSGMAARVDARGASRWSAQGLGLIDPDLALELIEPLWACGATEVGVQPLNWAAFLRQIPAGAIPPLLEAFAGEALAQDATNAIPETSKFLEELEQAPLAERLTMLQEELRSQIAAVLGIPSPEEIELRARLFDLGLDSLMAVELKSRLERTLCFTLRPTLVFDYPTIEALAAHFAQDTLARFFSITPESEDVEPEDEALIAAELERELSDLERGSVR